ncbi:decaprenyl-phosphate phosphoribosyltransferase [Jatrophihabitans sp. DSM 45814]
MLVLRVLDREARPGSQPDLVHGLWQAARPKQWAKNVLVFAAAGAAGQLGHFDYAWRSGVAFVAFCLAASGTYYLNDAADVDSDRRHPTKRLRPMAAGVFSPNTGRMVGAGLMLLSLLVASACLRWQLVVIVAIYIANTTAYSKWLKHMPVYDILSVAGGFLLRAIAGGAATGLVLSDWFLTVASFGSLFMVAGKRYAEHTALAESEDGHVRAVMKHYTASYLGYVRTVASSALLVSYCLFAFQKAEATPGHFPWYQLSAVPFVAAVFRYALLLEGGKGENPEDVVFGDRSLLVLGLCWIALFAGATY